MNKEELNCYYQSNIKNSRNEDSVYAIKYASQQMLIDKLEHNWNELKKWLEGYIRSYENRMMLPIGDVIKLSKEKMILNNVLDKMTELERGEE